MRTNLNRFFAYSSIFTLMFFLLINGVKAQEKNLEDLTQSLKNLQWTVRRDAAKALGSKGEAAVPALIKALNDREWIVRNSAAEALKQIGPSAKDAVNTLILSLQHDPEQIVRGSSADALGRIGINAQDAVPALISALGDMDPIVKSSASNALHNIGEPAVPLLITALDDKLIPVRLGSAVTLGKIGGEAQTSVPALIKALKDADPDVRKAAAQAQKNIALDLRNSRSTESIGVMQDIYNALSSQLDQDFGQYASEVQPAIAFIGNISPTLQYQTEKMILSQPYIAGGIGLYFFIIFSSILLFWFKPLMILKLSNMFSGYLKPIKYLLGFGFLQYRPRVLNAWVVEHIPLIREHYRYTERMNKRQVTLNIPGHINGESSLKELTATRIRATFKDTKCLLIHGWGGTGKTTLANQIAQWSMSETQNEWLMSHPMMPVMIDQELDFPSSEGRDHFTEAVRTQLRVMIDEKQPIDETLVKRLLVQQRVLVIVDHLSEMSNMTRQRIQPATPGFLAKALVVTSRNDENLDNIPRATIQIPAIEGTRLSAFMDDYLKAKGKREQFETSEFYEACHILAKMGREKGVTVLLARLFADQMIAIKETGANRSLPDNVPNLMLAYMDELNRVVQVIKGDALETEAVHEAAKTIAWKCMEESYRPGLANVDNVQKLLKSDTKFKNHLLYLKDNLRLIRLGGPLNDQVRFNLSSLGEYLAGLYIVDQFKTDADWNEFFTHAKTKEGAPETIKGFLFAVRDCSLTHGSNVPASVIEELNKMTGLELRKVEATPQTATQAEAVKSSIEDQIQQQIAEHNSEVTPQTTPTVEALLQNLNVTDTDERVLAIESIGELRSDGSAAVPALIKILNDTEVNIRWASAQALGKLGSNAKEAVSPLIDALKDSDRSVRLAAAQTLGKIGPDAQAAVPALIESLKDQDEAVRETAAQSLGEIGHQPKEAVPALMNALEDPEWTVRWAVAEALGIMGPKAGEAVPALMNALQDPEENVREATVQALGQIQNHNSIQDDTIHNHNDVMQ